MTVTETSLATTAESDPPPVSRSKKLLWTEIAVVLLFAYVPSAFAQLLGRSNVSGAIMPAFELAFSSTGIALILHIVWIGDGNLRSAGFTKPRWLLDIGLGLVLSYLFFLSFRLVESLIPETLFRAWRSMGQSASVLKEISGRLPLWAIFPSLFAVNSFEEVLMRGYLTGRLLEILPTRWAPVILSSVLFACWHWYEGPLGAINAFLIGLILGFTFLKIRRIWPLIFAHFLYDGIITLGYWSYFHSSHSHL